MIIGYTYVVGDILHLGHIQYLRNAKRLCDKLIVGVLTDEAVMERKPRPVVCFEERVAVVSALECVDAVVCQAAYSPLGNVWLLKPDILFESASHDDPCVNPFGRTLVMPYFSGHSSTQIKEAARSAEPQELS